MDGPVVMQWERVRPDSVVNGLNDMLSRQRTVTGPLNQTFEELRGVVDAFSASRWRHDVSSVHTSRSPRRVYGVNLPLPPTMAAGPFALASKTPSQRTSLAAQTQTRTADTQNSDDWEAKDHPHIRMVQGLPLPGKCPGTHYPWIHPIKTSQF